MSNHRFCHHCGSQVIVGSKFCSGCGTSLASLTATPPQAQAPVAPSAQQHITPYLVQGEDEEGEDSYLDRIPRLDIKIKGLSVNFSKDNVQVETVGNAIINGSPIPQDGYQRPTIDPAQALSIFQKEAGTSRQA
jgi:hypothetical protein